MPIAVVIRPVMPADMAEIDRLHGAVLGPGRFVRTAYRVREGSGPITPLCRLAELDGQIIAALRMTPITIGGKAGAQMLGPLVVAGQYANKGHGRALVADSLATATASGVRLVVLVGDLGYYQRMKFAPVPIGQIRFNGPVDPARILARELVEGGLSEYSGTIQAERVETA